MRHSQKLTPDEAGKVMDRMLGEPDLPPIEPCHGCGVMHCDYAKAGEPCWGETWLADETLEEASGEVVQRHACEGHEDVAHFTTGKYLKPGDASILDQWIEARDKRRKEGD